MWKMINTDLQFELPIPDVTDSMPFKHVAAFFAAKPYSMYISHAGTYMRDVMKNVGTR